MPTDEEKAKKIEPRPMYVFLLDNDEELDEPPPQLALRPDLEVDDVVCNRPLTSNPQLWVWSPTGRGSSSWKAVLRGYTRGSDGRRLNLSGDPLRPVWIGDEWYRKLLRKEKAADHLRSVQGKTQGKGNQRGKCSITSNLLLANPLTYQSLVMGLASRAQMSQTSIVVVYELIYEFLYLCPCMLHVQ